MPTSVPAPQQVYVPYMSPLGPMTVAARLDCGEGGALMGVWFDGQAHDRRGLSADAVALPTHAQLPESLEQARRCLDAAFSRRDHGVLPPCRASGTDFQRLVWELLCDIPRGHVRTYGALAQLVEQRTGRACSARAVGTAVGRNPISILIPCHRVVGAGMAITGYAGGLERKRWLLESEGVVLR